MKQRIISAIIALAICIPIVLLGGNVFYLGISLLGLIGYYELLKAKSKEKDLPILIKIFGLIIFIIIMLYEMNTKIILNIKSIFILDLFLLIVPIVFYDSKKYNIYDSTFMVGFTLLLGIAFNALINVRFVGLYTFIYLVLITTMTDTFAYFTGYLFGKHKVCPKVSPNKTWEGCIGGFLLGTIISSLFYIFLISNSHILITVLISSLLSVTCQIGDLIFSAIKRYFNIKDYGNIMPGHGGVLDRLDSLLWVVLMFSFLTQIL